MSKQEKPECIQKQAENFKDNTFPKEIENPCPNRSPSLLQYITCV
jgi:hypothetical protein